MNCIAATNSSKHEATQIIGGLPYCDAHADWYRQLAEPPANLERLVRKIRRRNHKSRLRMLNRMSAAERIWVSKRLAGWDPNKGE